MDKEIEVKQELQFEDVTSCSDTESISRVLAVEENINATAHNSDFEENINTEIKGSPESSICSQVKTESFSEDPVGEIKNEKFKFSNNCEIHTRTGNKEETIVPEIFTQNEGGFSNNTEMKLNKCPEIDIKIEIKEEQLWLETNSTETTDFYDGIKDGTDGNFPSAESSKSYSNVALGSQSTSVCHKEMNNHTGFSMILNNQTAERFNIHRKASIMYSERNDGKIGSIVLPSESRNLIQNTNATHGLNTNKDSSFKSVTTKDTLHSECRLVFSCGICNKSFTAFLDFKEHNLIHEGKRSYKCDVCNKCFYQSSNLKRHTLTHEGKKPYKCSVCEKCFTTSSDLKQHNMIHEGKRPYRCDLCDKSFIRLSDLKIHSVIHSGKKPYKCDVCEKAFNHSSNLRKHSMNHEGKTPYKCDVCEKAFTHVSYFKRHILIHEDRRTQVCDVCEKGFGRLSDFRIHYMTHKGKIPYKCQICDKAFTCLSDLRKHCMIHEGKRPYKCDVCDRTFTQLSNFRKHCTIHEGKRPYQCGVCEKAFNRLSNLKRHNLIHGAKAT